MFGYVEPPSGGSGSGSSTSPGGADTQVQFNDAGSFGGDAGLTWDKTNDVLIITSASANAFVVGPNGNTNPVLRIVDNVASAATGLSITANAAGAGVTLTALSSGSNETIRTVPKGTGVFAVQQPGGTPGTNELQISHGGTNATVANPATNATTTFSNAGSNRMCLSTINLTVRSDITIGWSATTDPTAGNTTALTRPADGIVGLYFSAAGGGLASIAKTPTQIAADTNNYSPGIGWFQRWSSDASRNITGMVAGQDGETRYIWNVGAQNIVLINASGSSSAANQFASATGADLTLTPAKCVLAMYDLTSTKWRITLLP